MTNPVINLYDELPDFANKENRSIHSNILKKNAELKSLQTECSDLQSRVKNLTQHLSSIKTEIGTSQGLLSAKVKQTEQEKHLQQLCDREQGKLKNELSKLKEDTEYIIAKVDAVQYKTAISQKRINEFKEESEINQQELEQWILIARQKEEDYLALQQYQKQDEGQIRALLSDIEKASSIIESKKAELDQEITATRALQIELNITAEHFRKMHEERSKLLSQWEQTLQQMQNLNESIEKMTVDYESRKSSVIALQNQLTEQEKILEEAGLSNQDLDRQTTTKKSIISQKNAEYDNESQSLSKFSEAVESQRHQLEKLEGDCRSYQGEINNYKERIAQDKARKEGYLVRLQGAQAGRIRNDIPKEIDELNDLIKKGEDELNSIESHVNDEKSLILKLSQEIYETRKNEKKMLDEIQNSQSYHKILSSKVKEIDKELQKQIEQLYTTNIQIQQMERKMGRSRGERTEEEKIEIQSKIDNLAKIIEEKRSADDILEKQIIALASELKQAKKKKDELQKKKNDLAVKLNELHIDQDSIDKSTVKARSQKENVLVQLNMLNLQVEKLSSQLVTKRDRNIESENQKNQLQFSLMERINEIDVHLSALRTQLKTEEEAKHQMLIELNEKKKRKDVLQSKYETMVGKIDEEDQIQIEKVANSQNDISGQSIQPCYIIQFAKERDQINLKGDQLEQELKIAIKELRGLEKAMEKLCGNYIAPSKAIEVLNKSGKISQNEKISLLEEQVSIARQKLEKRNEEANKAAEERQKVEDLLEYQQKLISEVQEQINLMKPVVEKISFENKEANDNLKRATSIFTRNRDEQRKKELKINDVSNLNELKYPANSTEMNVEYKILRSIVEGAVNQLSILVQNNREIESKVEEGLEKIGIKVNKGQKSASNTPTKAAMIVKPKTSAAITSSRSNSSIAAHSPVLNKRATPSKCPNIPKITTSSKSPNHLKKIGQSNK